MAIEINKIVEPKRILVIKFSSIGDIVLTTSPIKSLRKQFPKANIDLLTREDFLPLIEGVDFVNTVIPFKRESGFWQLIKTGKWINSNYDFVFDFHNSLRSKIILSQVRKIEKRQLIKPRWKRFLLFRFRKNTFTPDFNQIKLLHKPISDLIDDNNHPPTELFVSSVEKKEASQYLKNQGIKGKYIAIVPGAAWSQKVWDAKNYFELFNKIKNVKKYGFVILGGKDDVICSELANLDRTYLNLQGETTLRESMAIITKSEIIIGADTGFIHAAEALGKDVVTILGPTSSETGAGANRSASITIENNDVNCRPCSQNGKRKCYQKKQYCMTSINAEFVFEDMKGLLN